jgi:ribosomal protein S18 acetylase RimI-like enzyme
MTHSIRPFLKNEIDSVLRVQQDAYSQDLQESYESIAAKREAYPKGCVGAFYNEALVGYAISFPWFSHIAVTLDTTLTDSEQAFDCYYMHDVAVLSTHRGQGIADKLVINCLNDARSNKLSVVRMVTVQGGENVWSRYGFTVDGLAHESYGSNAYKMGLTLEQ